MQDRQYIVGGKIPESYDRERSTMCIRTWNHRRLQRLPTATGPYLIHPRVHTFQIMKM